MPQIVVNVSKEGKTTVTVQGVTGSGCRELTKALESALGKSTNTELTSAYYEESQTNAMQAGQQ